jgi:hypothetical protein
MATGVRSGTASATAVDALIEAASRGALTEAQAEQLSRQDHAVVVLALLAASKRIAEVQWQSQASPPSPATPSGIVPIYTKSDAAKRRDKPGARQGHLGRRR